MPRQSLLPWVIFLGVGFPADSLLVASVRAQWTLQVSGTKARLRGLCVVDSRVVWASGTQGTVIHTRDSGVTWQVRPVPGAADLDFRDIHAVDDRTAYVLSIGEGEKSRIYKTTDEGKTWSLQHVNRDPKGFLDAFAFWDSVHGIALGDPVEGRFMIVITDDGGIAWKRIPDGRMPLATPRRGCLRRERHLPAGPWRT